VRYGNVLSNAKKIYRERVQREAIYSFQEGGLEKRSHDCRSQDGLVPLEERKIYLIAIELNY
jgi:hypothetical protein